MLGARGPFVCVPFTSNPLRIALPGHFSPLAPCGPPAPELRIGVTEPPAVPGARSFQRNRSEGTSSPLPPINPNSDDPTNEAASQVWPGAHATSPSPSASVAGSLWVHKRVHRPTPGCPGPKRELGPSRVPVRYGSDLGMTETHGPCTLGEVPAWEGPAMTPGDLLLGVFLGVLVFWGAGGLELTPPSDPENPSCLPPSGTHGAPPPLVPT